MLLLLMALATNWLTAILRRRAEGRLRRTEDRFRALIENSSDVIALLDHAGAFTYLSPSITRVMGYAPAELVGRRGGEVIHPEDRKQVMRVFEELLAAPGQARSFRFRVRRPDQGWCWLDNVAANLLAEPAVGAVVFNSRDVTAEVELLQQLEERVEARTRELRALYEADALLHRSLRLDDVLQALVEAAVELLGAGSAAVSLRDPRHERLQVRAAQGISGELDRRLTELPGIALLYQVADSGEPIVVDDVRDDPRLPPQVRAINEEYGIRSLFIYPIALGGEVLGVFAARSTRPGAFGSNEERLLTALAQRAGLAIQNARQYEQAERLAALDERQRLSRELHDSVSQVLYRIALNASTAEAVREAAPERLPTLHAEVLALAEAGLAEMRALIFELRPESLEREGLVAALEKQTAAVRARHGRVVQATLPEEPDVPLPVKDALYRIAQEALQNTTKHARPRAVQVALEVGAEELVLCVSDDGKGFDPTEAFPGHLGLHSMRERATAVGAALEVESAPGVGTRIVARVPVAARAQSG
ncbi:MAG TPA: GAF domain-containing protein [Chloroflexota bacterium]